MSVRKSKTTEVDENSVEYWKKRALASENKDGDNEDIYISPDKNIRVMSLCNHTLNLTSGSGKDAKQRVFTSFGQVKSIPYSILVEMIEAHPTFAENGVYYILDKDVIKKTGLEEAYSKILRKDDIERILNESDNALALYKTLNPKQREMVNDMLVERIRKGRLTDLSLISAFERESGIELMEKAKSSKEFFEANPQFVSS